MHCAYPHYHGLVKIFINREPSLIACHSAQVYLILEIAADADLIVRRFGLRLVLVHHRSLILDQLKISDLCTGRNYSCPYVHVSVSVGIVGENSVLSYINNVDIITLARNMYSHGVDPKLDLSNMNYLVEKYEKCTRMHVNDRAPYAGALVFAAFSGSHQDAIAKGMKFRNKNKLHVWNVPYIPIDPKDIGRTYDADVIRVNSQSGKGGIGYLLEQSFGYNLPAKMREHFSYLCKGVSDHEHKELKPDEVLNIFEENYLNLDCGIEITDFDFMRENEAVKINVTFKKDGVETEMEAEGNGSLSAINHALSEFTGENYTLQVFTQHSMQGDGSRSVAASYIGLQGEDGTYHWGAGTDTDVITASTKALFSAFYNMTKGDAK